MIYLSDSAVLFVELVLFLVCLILFLASCILFAYNMRNRWDYAENTFQWRFPIHELTPIEHNVVLDQHAHTNFKGGNLSIRQNIRWHLANGFNAMVITEHNTFNDPKLLAEVQAEFGSQFHILEGMEWTTERIHMNFLNLNSWEMKIPPHPTDEDVQQAIKHAHDHGAIVVVNHARQQRKKDPTSPTFEQLLAWGIDFVEVQGQKWYDEDAVKFCQQHGLGMISGTDVHFPIPVNGWTLLQVKEISIPTIIQALKDRQTQVLYDQKGSPDYTIRRLPKKSRNKLIFLLIGQVFSQTDHSQLRIHWTRILTVLGILGTIFLLAQCIGLWL
jgi:predicted metal-dependent phosphoesterase TrpH